MRRTPSIVFLLVTVLCGPALGECRWPECGGPSPEDLPILWGLVVDDQGAPIPGATVAAIGSGPTAVAVSDADGRFWFRRLPTGIWDLRAELSGFTTETEEGILIGYDSVERRDIAIAPAIGEIMIIACGWTCGEEPAIHENDPPPCEERDHNSELIDDSERGDLAATRELADRFAFTISLEERRRIAVELILRLERDDVYFDFLHEEAERLIGMLWDSPPFSAEGEASTPLERYAEAHGVEPYDVIRAGSGAVADLARCRDSRAIPVLLRALDTHDESLTFDAIVGLGELRYEPAVPRVLEAFERTDLQFMWPFLLLFEDERARSLAMEIAADDPTRDQDFASLVSAYPWIEAPAPEEWERVLAERPSGGEVP